MKLVQVILFVFLLAVGGQSIAEQAIGKVAFVTGIAYAQTETGAKVKLQQGNAIFVGQTLSTATLSHLHLNMMDGGFISLRPNAEVQVKRYNVDLARPANNQIQLDVHKGVVRSITGKGGQSNKSGFRLNTPVAAIGIRGTDFTVYTDDVNSSVSIRQGGVVVSPFSAWCSREALGACSGDQAVVLSAGVNQSVLAEVSVAQAYASLVKEEQARVIPDEIQPAHPIEDKSAQETRIIPQLNNTSIPASSGSTGSNTSSDQGSTSSATDAKDGNASSGASSGQANGDTTKETTNGSSQGATKSATTSSGESSTNQSTAGTETTTTNSTASSNTTAETTQTTTTSTDVTATATTSATAEVASLTPVTGNVGAKESVTSELASQVIAEAVAAESVKVMTDAATNNPNTGTGEQVFSSKTKTTPLGSNEHKVVENSVYVVSSTDTSAVNLPHTGNRSFTMDQGVAAVKVNGELKNATIVDPKLSINFDNNTFATSLSVKSEALTDGSANLNATGALTSSNASFANDTATSNMVVAGALSGDGTHAGYVFEQTTTGVVGATTWQVQP